VAGTYLSQGHPLLTFTVSLGNAKIEGLLDSIHVTGDQYNIALSIFFIPYVLGGKRVNPGLLVPVPLLITLLRGPEQHAAEEVQTPFLLPRGARAMLGNRHDLHGLCAELLRPGCRQVPPWPL